MRGCNHGPCRRARIPRTWFTSRPTSLCCAAVVLPIEALQAGFATLTSARIVRPIRRYCCMP